MKGSNILRKFIKVMISKLKQHYLLPWQFIHVVLQKSLRHPSFTTNKLGT
jgi:hypothetical protein